MKLSTLITLNKAGITNAETACKYAFGVLRAASYNASALVVRAAIAAKPANAANTALAANALFPGSPAFAAGAARPAYPAINAPAVVALPEVQGMATEAVGVMTVYLPIVQNAGIVGADAFLPEYKKVGEITPAALLAADWFGTPSGGGTEVVQPVGMTMEQYFYKNALTMVGASAPAANAVITDEAFVTPSGKSIACKKIVVTASGAGNPE